MVMVLMSRASERARASKRFKTIEIEWEGMKETDDKAILIYVIIILVDMVC